MTQFVNYSETPIGYVMDELKATYDNTGGGCMVLAVPHPTTEHPHGAVVMIGKFEDQIDNFSGRRVADADSVRLTGFHAIYHPRWNDPDGYDDPDEYTEIYESEDFYAPEIGVDMPDAAFNAANRLNAWREAGEVVAAIKAFMLTEGE